MSVTPIFCAAASASRKYVKLLVVDDHQEQFEHISVCAEMYNAAYRVECRLVASRDEAVALSKEWAPSVVLLDLHLPGSDSLELLKRFAERGAAVVAMSATRSIELAETAQEYGAVAYVPKSENPEDVEALVDLLATVANQEDPVH